MKIFHHVFTKDGQQITEKEITNNSKENMERMRKYEETQAFLNPGCHFRLSFMAEEGDGLDYKNVPQWKIELAAEILQSNVQSEIAAKVKPANRIGAEHFETRH